MRALLPKPAAEVDLVAAYAPPDGARAGRPFVRLNMISTLDGAITVGGRSGMLGGPADGRVFQVLRSLADVILVGAGTARAEGYGPARLGAEHRAERARRGQAPVPPIAVVTASGHLDWSRPFFTEAEARPIVFTSGPAGETTRELGGAVADVVVSDGAGVDLGHALAHLHDRGWHSVLLEGGPGLNAEVVEAGLLDELCLTLAPRLVAGDGPRLLAGPAMLQPLDLAVLGLLEEDGFLFFRLAVAGGRPAAT